MAAFLFYFGRKKKKTSTHTHITHFTLLTHSLHQLFFFFFFFIFILLSHTHLYLIIIKILSLSLSLFSYITITNPIYYSTHSLFTLPPQKNKLPTTKWWKDWKAWYAIPFCFLFLLYSFIAHPPLNIILLCVCLLYIFFSLKEKEKK